MLSRDVDLIAKCMTEIMKHGYQNTESDLFVARAILELICRSENFELAKRLRKLFPEVKSPIVNFAELLPELIELEDFGLF